MIPQDFAREGIFVPTVYRQRLPEGLSYLFGAEEISAFLHGFPHLECCRIRFARHAAETHSGWRQVLKAKGQLEIFRIEPVHPVIAALSPKLSDDCRKHLWEVAMFALPSAERQTARRAFVSTVLPQLPNAVSRTSIVAVMKVYFDRMHAALRVQLTPR